MRLALLGLFNGLSLTSLGGCSDFESILILFLNVALAMYVIDKESE